MWDGLLARMTMMRKQVGDNRILQPTFLILLVFCFLLLLFIIYYLFLFVVYVDAMRQSRLFGNVDGPWDNTGFTYNR